MLKGIALTFHTLSTIVNLAGGARHTYYLSISQQETIFKLAVIDQPIAVLASVVSKPSVAFLVLHLLGPNAVWRRNLIRATLGVCSGQPPSQPAYSGSPSVRRCPRFGAQTFPRELIVCPLRSTSTFRFSKQPAEPS